MLLSTETSYYNEELDAILNESILAFTLVP